MSLGSLVLHTPGPWKVGLTDDGTGVEIKPPQDEPKLDFRDRSLVFSIENISVSRQPGKCSVRIDETVFDEMDHTSTRINRGVVALDKLKAEFVVDRFWADPPSVGAADESVNLYWTGSGAPSDNYTFQLRSGAWMPRDCMGGNQCYNLADGAQGQPTFGLREATDFYLDVIYSNGTKRI